MNEGKSLDAGVPPQGLTPVTPEIQRLEIGKVCKRRKVGNMRDIEFQIGQGAATAQRRKVRDGRRVCDQSGECGQAFER